MITMYHINWIDFFENQNLAHPLNPVIRVGRACPEKTPN